MSARDLIDPEMRAALDAMLEAIPGGYNSIPDIVKRREVSEQLAAARRLPPSPGIAISERTVPGPVGAPDITLRIYRPEAVPGPRPGIYFIHGGGMILGSARRDDGIASMLSEQLGATVVSVEYRLAPENPHPAHVEDCYAGLDWTAHHVSELDIDAGRIAIYGASAGGGLTIATALMARDEGYPAIRFQMPIYPMIHNGHDTPSSYEITDVGIWDRRTNIEAWQWYLGGGPADDYAVPALAKDLAGLPPTYIDVGTVDLFRDEDVAFATRLMHAGVPTELHVWPGAYHGAENTAPQAELSRRIWAGRIEALRRALA
jgi:acetyl esterase/lipase